MFLKNDRRKNTHYKMIQDVTRCYKMFLKNGTRKNTRYNMIQDDTR